MSCSEVMKGEISPALIELAQLVREIQTMPSGSEKLLALRELDRKRREVGLGDIDAVLLRLRYEPQTKAGPSNSARGVIRLEDPMRKIQNPLFAKVDDARNLDVSGYHRYYLREPFHPDSGLRFGRIQWSADERYVAVQIVDGAKKYFKRIEIESGLEKELGDQPGVMSVDGLTFAMRVDGITGPGIVIRDIDSGHEAIIRGNYQLASPNWFTDGRVTLLDPRREPFSFDVNSTMGVLNDTTIHYNGRIRLERTANSLIYREAQSPGRLIEIKDADSSLSIDSPDQSKVLVRYKNPQTGVDDHNRVLNLETMTLSEPLTVEFSRFSPDSEWIFSEKLNKDGIRNIKLHHLKTKTELTLESKGPIQFLGAGNKVIYNPFSANDHHVVDLFDPDLIPELTFDARVMGVSPQGNYLLKFSGDDVHVLRMKR